MNKLLLAFMLFASIKSNGQKYDTTSFGSISERDTTFKSRFSQSMKVSSLIWNNSPAKMAAYINPGSDTLHIIDTILELYGNKIRYIKINSKVYPLKSK